MSDQSAEIAAEFHGVKVPMSRFLTSSRIARLNSGRYEGTEITGGMAIIRPGDRVLEIGAGIGVVGAAIALNCAPAQVCSFEANPELIPVIEATYSLNGLGGVISVRNTILLGAGDLRATVGFNLHKSYLGSSLHDIGDKAYERVEVPTTPFNSFCDHFRPDVLMIDIEGGELELLRGVHLASFRAVVIEFHPGVYGMDGMRECKSILRKAGFAKIPHLSTRSVWTCEKPQSETV